MRNGMTYRAARKDFAKYTGQDLAPWDKQEKVGPGRRMKWLMRHPKLGVWYKAAINILQNGDRAQKPSWKAVRKIMVVLATAPRVSVEGLGNVPYPLAFARHERLTWRQYPHQTIDANLKVVA